MNPEQTYEFKLAMGWLVMIMTSLTSWLLTLSTTQLIFLLYCTFLGVYCFFWSVFYLTSMVFGHTTLKFSCKYENFQTEERNVHLGLKFECTVIFKEGRRSEKSCLRYRHLSTWPSRLWFCHLHSTVNIWVRFPYQLSGSEWFFGDQHFFIFTMWPVIYVYLVCPPSSPNHIHFCKLCRECW